MDRSAENQRVGNVTIAAWQMEERAEQRMSVGRLPDSLNGRVRDAGGDTDIKTTSSVCFMYFKTCLEGN